MQHVHQQVGGWEKIDVLDFWSLTLYSASFISDVSNLSNQWTTGNATVDIHVHKRIVCDLHLLSPSNHRQSVLKHHNLTGASQQRITDIGYRWESCKDSDQSSRLRLVFAEYLTRTGYQTVFQWAQRKSTQTLNTRHWKLWSSLQE